MSLIGLRGANVPTDEETGLMLKFIITHYGGHTCAELELAFTLSQLRQLDLDEDEIPCYENFSIAYVSRIMTAYRKWAVERHQQLVKPALPPPVAREEITQEGMDKWMEENRVMVLADQTFPEFLPLDLVAYGIKTGLFPDWDELYPFALQKAVHRFEAFLDLKAKDDKRQEPVLLHFQNQMEKGYFEGDDITILGNLASRLMLWKALGGKKL